MVTIYGVYRSRATRHPVAVALGTQADQVVLPETDQRARTGGPSTDLVCAARARGHLRILTGQGFTKSVNLRGGLVGWRAENLPLSKDAVAVKAAGRNAAVREKEQAG